MRTQAPFFFLLLLTLALGMLCGCPPYTSPKEGNFSVQVSLGGGAASKRDLTDDTAVVSVDVEALSADGTRIGSGPLTKDADSWSGTILVHRTGSALFKARARDSSSNELYYGEAPVDISGRSDAVTILVQHLPALPGAGIVTWGDFLYVIGGEDSSGKLCSQVWMAKVGANGVLGQWQQTVSLPQPRAFASCVVAGPFVYVMGGETASGLSSDVLFALVDTTTTDSTYGGLCGFGVSNAWQANFAPLAVPMSRAAAAADDRKIVLVGGLTAGGPVSTVYYAQIKNDGSVGKWYTSPNCLPGAVTDAGATVSNGEVWVAGGLGSNGPTSTVLSSDWSGVVNGQWQTQVPAFAREFPVLRSTADGLLLFGGFDGDKALADGMELQGSGWQSMTTTPAQAYGPSSAVNRGALSFVTAVDGDNSPTVGSYALSALVSDPPVVTPGSGWLPSGTKVWAYAPLDETIRYTSGPTMPANPPTINTGTAWDLSTLPKSALTPCTVSAHFDRVRAFSSRCPHPPRPFRQHVRPRRGHY